MINYDCKDGLAVIRLERPEQHNALSQEGISELLRLVADIELDATVRALLLTAPLGQTFCAGADLSELSDQAISIEQLNKLMDRLAHLPIPSLCAMGGSVYGAGAELALCCDWRIGVDNMKLQVPAAEIGLCYSPPGIRRYMQRLGLSATLRLLTLAEKLPADELLRMGYLTHSVEESEFLATVDAMCQHMLGLAPLAVKSMKSIALSLAESGHELEQADELVAACLASEDLKIGLQAKKQGQQPNFKGR